VKELIDRNKQDLKSWFTDFSKSKPKGFIDIPLFHFSKSYIQALLPEYPPLEFEEQQIIERDLIKVIHEQLSFISFFLKLPMLFLILFFETSILISRGKKFSSLGKSRRLEFINKWSSSPFSFKRDLFKFFRTLTLFSFYDHPIVHDKLGVKLGKRNVCLESAGNL